MAGLHPFRRSETTRKRREVVGVPKTIDNDLAARITLRIRYRVNVVTEPSTACILRGSSQPCHVVEVMGRNAGCDRHPQRGFRRAV